MKVVGNKSYNELIERLVDYRGVLMTEKASKNDVSVVEKRKDTELSSNTEVTQVKDEKEVKPEAASVPAPLEAPSTTFLDLSIDVNNAPVSTQSSNVIASVSSPKNSPSQQTLQAMMKERHISDADARDTATTLLEEGPILEDFFNSTASQLTYYGLVKLQEGLRERQLCVFFRNNHFSTLFKVGKKSLCDIDSRSIVVVVILNASLMCVLNSLHVVRRGTVSVGHRCWVP